MAHGLRSQQRQLTSHTPLQAINKLNARLLESDVRIPPGKQEVLSPESRGGQSATSAIARVALRTKVFNIC